jgi:regulator of extracellular matrix RemA (YlzA/DUF370 family)
MKDSRLSVMLVQTFAGRVSRMVIVMDSQSRILSFLEQNIGVLLLLCELLRGVPILFIF